MRWPEAGEPVSVRSLLQHVTQTLAAAGVVNASQEARWIAQAALEGGALDVLAAAKVSTAALRRAEELARRRATGEPLQYVTGRAGFRHLEIDVGPGVFIPRPETELVAERAMELLPRGGNLVDVGTGSGAIALAVATERPDARVVATESSERALAYARANRAAIGADLELVCCDVLEGVSRSLQGRVDVLVSNPPYVPPAERHLLARDVAEHEPPEALFAAGDGLEVIRRITSEAPTWLRPGVPTLESKRTRGPTPEHEPGGWIVLEIGDRQGPAVRKLLEQLGYQEVAVRRDLTGRERIAEGRL